MLLSLRSKLWGVRTQQNVSGSGATIQSQQSNAGRCLWYSALTKNVVYLSTTIKKLIEASDEPLLIPSIEGDGASRQSKQQSNGKLRVAFEAQGSTIQSRRRSQAVAYQIIPISGSGDTMQESGWSTAAAEHVDVELEVLAAILSAI